MIDSTPWPAQVQPQRQIARSQAHAAEHRLHVLDENRRRHDERDAAAAAGDGARGEPVARPIRTGRPRRGVLGGSATPDRPWRQHGRLKGGGSAAAVGRAERRDCRAERRQQRGSPPPPLVVAAGSPSEDGPDSAFTDGASWNSPHGTAPRSFAAPLAAPPAPPPAPAAAAAECDAAAAGGAAGWTFVGPHAPQPTWRRPVRHCPLPCVPTAFVAKTLPFFTVHQAFRPATRPLVHPGRLLQRLVEAVEAKGKSRNMKVTLRYDPVFHCSFAISAGCGLRAAGRCSSSRRGRGRMPSSSPSKSTQSWCSWSAGRGSASRSSSFGWLPCSRSAPAPAATDTSTRTRTHAHTYTRTAHTHTKNDALMKYCPSGSSSTVGV